MDFDYERKYKEALERARALNNNGCVDVQQGTTICEYIFPELVEFSNKEIITSIINFIKANAQGCVFLVGNGPRVKTCLDWLEKQRDKMSDPRYRYLDALVDADDIYQMSTNVEMIMEAKEKAINALSKLDISKALSL